MIRTVRNLVALACLTVSWGVTGLWVRSYWRVDVLEVAGQVNFSSLHGVTGAYGVFPLWQTKVGGTGWSTLPTSKVSKSLAQSLGRWSFGYQEVRATWHVRLPHWFVAAVLGLLALALKPRPRLRFSLADFLILMTMSALLLAGAAGLTRLAA